MRAATPGPDRRETGTGGRIPDGDERQSDRAARTVAAIQVRGRPARPRAACRRVLAPGQVRRRPHRRRAAAARRGGRPDLLRPRRADLRDRAVRPLARDQVRDVRDHAHQGRDHRRAALDGLGAAQRARPRPRDGARERQARERAAARADRPGDGGRAEDHRGRAERVAACDLALLDGRAGRAVATSRLQRRPGLADGHDRGSRPRPTPRRRSTWAT